MVVVKTDLTFRFFCVLLGPDFKENKSAFTTVYRLYMCQLMITQIKT